MAAKHFVPDKSTGRAACGAIVDVQRDAFAISIYSAKCRACESAVRESRRAWRDGETVTVELKS